ncbi:jerky protein homolog-like [Osmia bicornis bicornis]|uniref:jerky protein homolog-like n=1 Tax=Osmia bicornis bicornis TaxID=1437191 RepID=UPI0010F95032|nr:jerky protein homolog-like [Osmia bicornis bicornis]
MGSNQPSTSGTSPTKRKAYATLTLQQKLEVVKEKDAGVSTNDIAVRYNVDESTVRKWVRDRKKLEKYSSSPSEFKRIRPSPVEKVNEALTIWFHRERRLKKTISVNRVKAKAQEFFQRFGGMETFKASDGWFRTWKKRNGIRLLNTSDEQLSVDTDVVANFKTQLLQLVEDEKLTSHQIFNAKETDLYFKMTPNESLGLKTECLISDNRKIKDKISVMACCNATGSMKMPLLVIGKYQKPRSLKNLAPRLLPVNYTNHPNAVMNAAIFETWFKDNFVPNVSNFLRSKGLSEKAILLFDDTKLHSSTNPLIIDGIKAVFLPANVTSLVQPLDQGIIEAIKNRYKAKLLTFILNAQELGENYDDAMKSFNIKHAVQLISQAWDEITEKNISNCWKNLLNLPVDPADNSEQITSESIHQISKQIRNLENIALDEVNEWIQADSKNLTDEDIIQIVQYGDNVKIEIENDDLTDAEISPSKALEAADCLILFCEKTEISISDMKVLRRLRQRIAKLTENA